MPNKIAVDLEPDIEVEEIDFDKQVDEQVVPEEIIEKHDDFVFEERPYQTKTVAEALKAVEAGHKTILIEAPTGSGKTIMAHTIAQELNKKFGWNYGWTCMRRALLAQAARVNKDVFKNDYGTYFSTFSKDLPNVDVIIEDEAQHSASNTSTRLNSLIKPKVHLALTATPFRTDNMKLCFSKVIKTAGMRSLVDQGYLAPYHHYVFNMEWSPQTVADRYLADIDKWGQSIAFFQTKAQCYEFQAILASAGIKSGVVIGGNIAAQEREITRLKTREVPILANVYTLVEGFDYPELRTAFIRPSVKGPTQQMGGRAFRKHKSKTFCQLVQNSFSKCMFTSLVSPERKFVEDDSGVWEERTAQTRTMNLVMRNTIKVIAKSTPNKMPAFIKKHKYNFGNRRGQMNESARNNNSEQVTGLDQVDAPVTHQIIMPRDS